MKSAETICRELKSVDGVVGAFVFAQSQCLATSLPPQYDQARLTQIGGAIRRISQMSQRAGIEKCFSAFHWQRASLLAWPLGDESWLAIMTAPHALREAVDLSASSAVEELSKASLEVLPQNLQSLRVEAPVVPDHALEAAVAPRLARIEQLLTEELGTSGKALLERNLKKLPRPTAPLAAWLLELRKAILAEVSDATARITIAMSVEWADSD